MFNLAASELDRRILWSKRKGEQTLKRSQNNELEMVSAHQLKAVIFCMRSKTGTRSLRFGGILAGLFVAAAGMVQAGD